MNGSNHARCNICYVTCKMSDYWYFDQGDSAQAVRADDAKWCFNRLGEALRKTVRFERVSAYKREPFPALGAVDGVIVGGSEYMLSEGCDPWVERLMGFVRQAAARQKPILGICFGHQLLARTFGASVVRRRPSEVGRLTVHIDTAGRDDPLFEGIADVFQAHLFHGDFVTDLGSQVTALAHSSGHANQAIAIGDAIRGVQFHPEFNTELMQILLGIRRETLTEEGLDVNAIARGVGPTPAATRVLENFIHHFVRGE